MLEGINYLHAKFQFNILWQLWLKKWKEKKSQDREATKKNATKNWYDSGNNEEWINLNHVKSTDYNWFW